MRYDKYTCIMMATERVLVSLTIGLFVVLSIVALLSACISVRPTATSHIKSTIVRTDTITTSGDIRVVESTKHISR